MHRAWYATDSVAIRTMALLIACMFCALLLWATGRPHPPQLRIGSKTFALEVADGEAARVKGLSGRDRLPANTAMLFVFPSAKRACFWMKDMRFPIDIVWLDKAKKITHIEKRVEPGSFPRTYCAEDRAKYVLELAAGSADRHHMRLGQTLFISE